MRYLAGPDRNAGIWESQWAQGQHIGDLVPLLSPGLLWGTRALDIIRYRSTFLCLTFSFRQLNPPFHSQGFQRFVRTEKAVSARFPGWSLVVREYGWD